MMKLRAKILSLRDLLATAWPIVLITAAGFWVAFQFVEPAPPRHMVMSTGSESGAYYAYAKRYASLLAAKGVTLEIRTSHGSSENLQRLQQEGSDIAFVQGGIHETLDDNDESMLRSLGSVAYEPVWVFYRAHTPVEKLGDLVGKRLAVGEEGSGVRVLALQLLAANGMHSNGSKLVPLAGVNAADALKKGEIDAVFVIAAQEAPMVQALLHMPGVQVMSFAQADAYLRRFPFLSKIVLPRGVVDLVRDSPPRDTVLLATTANVVVREDLHPALVSLLMQVMSEVNGKSGFFQQAGEFPAYKDRSFELSSDAARFYKSGPSFLQRYLPFWLAVLVERLFVLLLPVVVLLFPLLRMAPAIYNWRVRSRVFRCYGDLKFLESDLRTCYDPACHAEYLARLDRIEEEAYARNIPLAFSDVFYTLCEHIKLVRDKLQVLQSENLTEKSL